LDRVIDSFYPQYAKRLAILNGDGYHNLILQLFILTSHLVSTIEDAILDIQDDESTPSKISKFMQHASWSYLLYDVFSNYQSAHMSWEETLLLEHLDKIFKSTGDLNKDLPSLSEKLPNIFKLSDLSIQKCAQFTYGMALPSLFEMLNTYYKSTCTKIRDLTTLIKIEKQEDDLTNDYVWDAFQTGLDVMNICNVFQTLWNTWVKNIAKNVDHMVENVKYITSQELVSEKKEICISGISVLKASALNNKKLQDVITNPDYLSTYLIKPISQSLENTTRHVQTKIFDIITSNIRNTLLNLKTQHDWSGTTTENTSPFNLAIPKFSKSPGNYMMQVDKDLLDIIQRLDIYTQPKSRHVGFEYAVFKCRYVLFINYMYSLEYVTREEIMQLRREYGSQDDESVDVDAQHQQQQQQKHNEQEVALIATHIWLIWISKAVMDWLWSGIQGIEKLSDDGCAQLYADVEYVLNVLGAMDIEIDERLKVFLENLHLQGKGEELRKMMDGSDAMMRSVLERIIAMRSI
jgi:hypothetical protein